MNGAFNRIIFWALLKAVADAMAPRLIVAAIFSGHLAAENFETPEIEIERDIYMREMPSLK